ncbi:hypothetical protein [Fischerella sp. PCC 9605]|uniref:hypothetical protein n=1 Tax=Fischerella sp. PCC 9605 TaxID=1173024 RepID=UPI00047AC9C7|nr:hypothetical protein [Fischerella sp. PCC 9605]
MNSKTDLSKLQGTIQQQLTHKVIALEVVKTIHSVGVDLAQYTDYELEVVPIDHPAEAEFSGTTTECEQWLASNYASYQYF